MVSLRETNNISGGEKGMVFSFVSGLLQTNGQFYEVVNMYKTWLEI